MSLFDLLSIFYVLLGIRAIATAAKNWRPFTDSELTAFDRRLANELAFFLLVPFGVLLHEFGHAAATYQVGGTIDWLGGGFHYAFFYGYVIPEGQFTPLQDWWIALSGNLVSVIYGFLPLVFIPFTDKAWVKYTILAFARIQLGWSLVGYPLITLTGVDSDWSTIYSTRTLVLGVPLLFVHVGLVAGLWWLDRSARVRRWEVGLYAGAGQALRSLEAAVAARPGAVDPLLTRGHYFATQGQRNLAIADYRAALQHDPGNPQVLYNLGQMHLMDKHYTAAERDLRAALPRAESDPAMAGSVHYGLGLCLYHRGASMQAVVEFNQAIARLPEVAEFYFWRGLARRASRDESNARSDLTRAAELAATTNPALAQQARELAGS
jgi:tetratricopeptide (TPR) repeat protein